MKTCQTFIKQSTQKRERERYKMDGSKSKQKEETTNQGGLQGEQDQIKYSTLPGHKEHMR